MKILLNTKDSLLRASPGHGGQGIFLILVIHHVVPPPFFMRWIFRMKLQTEHENSNYFMRLGNTALSHQGGAPVAGEKAPKNVFKLKNKNDSLHEFPASTSLWYLY